jgi:hypothetical protein
MNGYTAVVLLNGLICSCVVLVAYFTKSPWALLGLLFLFSLNKG